LKRRAVVALALIAAGCAARGGRISHNDGNGTIALAEEGDGCKKRYVTRYLEANLAAVREGRSKVTWFLANACQKEPPQCKRGAKLELEFYKWEYTPALLRPGQPAPSARSIVKDPPAPLDCPLRNEVKLGANVVLRCGATKEAKAGTYRFQVRFSCDDVTVDNWDPEILFEGGGEG